MNPPPANASNDAWLDYLRGMSDVALLMLWHRAHEEDNLALSQRIYDFAGKEKLAITARIVSDARRQHCAE